MCYPVWGEHAFHLWSLWPPEVNEKNVRGESWMTKKHWNPPSLLVGASLYPSLGDVLRSTVPPTPKNQCITCMFRGGPKKLIFQDLVLNRRLLWWNNNLSIATPAGGEKRREESFCWDVAVNWATLSTCPSGHTTDKLSHVNIVWVHSTCFDVCVDMCFIFSHHDHRWETDNWFVLDHRIPSVYAPGRFGILFLPRMTALPRCSRILILLLGDSFSLILPTGQ